jgi:hypothetical protein
VLQTHAITTLTVSLGGADDLEVSGPPTPPNHDGFGYTSGSTRPDEITIQWDHPNIEAAKNQCFPASVANSLQYLRNRYGLAVPHEHKPGLRPSASPGDSSLVGQIDEAMNRQVTNRRTGKGITTGGLKGKLNYIARNKLHQRLQVTHYGSFNGDDGASNMSSDTIDGARLSSTGAGASVNLDAVFRALAAGENCEAIYSWSTTHPDGTVKRGAHAVDLIGGSSLMGRRSLAWASDVNQDSDSAGAGLAGVENVEVDGPDANGQYSLGGGSNRRLRLVICEKFVPPPFVRTVLRVVDPRGHACCVNPPPMTMSIALGSGGAMTLTGSGASWLPMTGSIANGRFDLNSRATVAGFANVTSRFTGSYAAGRYEGTLTVGAAGELPGAVPISYDLRIEEGQASQIMPAMRLNGQRQALRLTTGDPVKPSISLGAGPFVGQSGDWFLVAGLSDGRWLRFDLATMAWVPGLDPTYTGPLFGLPFFALPVVENLPAGTHAFYFGFDVRPNGQLDLDAVVYERTELTVVDPMAEAFRRP